MPEHDLTAIDTPVADLAFYHRNPRKGNVDVIAESLKRSGQYRPIVVNRGTLTGRPNEILAGNHTAKAAVQLGWSTVAAVFVDVDDEAATRIVVTDNRTADLGDYDNDTLADLLTDLPDLEGTGYTRDKLDDLLADLADTRSDALDDGESDEDNYHESFTVVVTCSDEANQAAVLGKLTELGYNVKPVTA